jgi:hypothetical protein
MARKPPAPAAKESAKEAKTSAKPAAGNARSASDAREELLVRGARNAQGAFLSRSDPLADAKAARAIVALVSEHARELSRRGLTAGYTEAALQLAQEIEEHLSALPAASVSVRGRSSEDADLLSDAAATAHAVRDAVLRVTRGPDGRTLAHAFGLGEPFSPRQHSYVLRALQRILAAAKEHPKVAEDIGLVAGDLQTMKDLAEELAKQPGADGTRGDEHRRLVEAQAALRAWFDLVAAKGSLAFAGDPDERARLFALIPRADDRRHLRRAGTEWPAA